MVGLQFKHSVFVERFLNFTTKHSKVICSAEQIDCYLLDNNAFIIYSEVHSQTGRFFGEFDNSLLQEMVNAKVYRKVHLYDYQAICLRVNTSQSRSSILLSPLKNIKTIVLWFWTRLFSLYVNIWYNSWFTYANGDYDNGEYEYENEFESKPLFCKSFSIHLIIYIFVFR